MAVILFSLIPFVSGIKFTLYDAYLDPAFLFKIKFIQARADCQIWHPVIQYVEETIKELLHQHNAGIKIPKEYDCD